MKTRFETVIRRRPENVTFDAWVEDPTKEPSNPIVWQQEGLPSPRQALRAANEFIRETLNAEREAAKASAEAAAPAPAPAPAPAKAA